MDPNCAVCNQPAHANCGCEAEEYEIKISEAEEAMMTSVLSEIRDWVGQHARDFILEYYNELLNHRQQTHAAQIRQLTERARYYNSHPHPTEIHHADVELKHNIDEDWKASVQRYPEVLQYFYGLVEVSLPSETDPSVTNPPFSPDYEQRTWRATEVRVRENSEEKPRRRRRRRRSERQSAEEESGNLGEWERVNNRQNFARPMQPGNIRGGVNYSDPSQHRPQEWYSY